MAAHGQVDQQDPPLTPGEAAEVDRILDGLRPNHGDVPAGELDGDQGDDVAAEDPWREDGTAGPLLASPPARAAGDSPLPRPLTTEDVTDPAPQPAPVVASVAGSSQAGAGGVVPVEVVDFGPRSARAVQSVPAVPPAPTTEGVSAVEVRSSEKGRFWAWAALLFGAVASIGGNVGHTFIAPPGSPVGWSPSVWSLGAAVVAPVFLFIAVKVITLVAWPPGVKWFLWRWVGTSAVIALTGIVSWNHMFGLLAHLGEEAYVCWLFPIGIDGLMLVGVGALMASKAGAVMARPTMPASAAVAPAVVNGHGLVPPRVGR